MQDVTIIDNYRDLPLGVYLDILDAVKANEGDELATQVAILSRLTGLNEQEVLDLPLDVYKRLAASAAFLREPCPDDLVRIADVYYAGALTLVPVKDYAKLTVAQYVDFQTFGKDVNANLVPLLSVLLVPEGCRYGEGYDIAQVQQAIRDWINVADAVGLAAHFFAFASRSIVDTVTFSRKLARTMKDGTAKTELLTKTAQLATLLSRGSGDGSPGSTLSPNSAAAPGARSGR